MKPWLDDGDVQFWQGDVRECLRALPAGVAQTCVTSPPYWGLRDYGADGQLGLEATPELYVERMVAVFREVWRVLRDDGTLWLNLGDSYASTNAGNRNGRDSATLNEGRSDFPVREATTRGHNGNQYRDLPPGLKAKDLVGIPWRVAFALQADGWYLRSDTIWSKPNPMPESVSDRPTKAHEYVFLLSKRARYFYDADAVREAAAPSVIARADYAVGGTKSPVERNDGGRAQERRYADYVSGRNLRSVWEVATEPFPEAHFATYPQALVRRCILAGTSERGECSACGAPWVRQVERTLTGGHAVPNARPFVHGANGSAESGSYAGASHVSGSYKVETIGWRASCSCSAPPRPQTVLDPFIGSGTTALVSRRLGRRCIGIDLSAEYLAIAAKRTQQLSLLGGAA